MSKSKSKSKPWIPENSSQAEYMQSKKKPRVFKITPDNGVIIGASYIGKTIDVPLPAGLAELEGSGPYEIRKKELPDTHRHPYSGPTFDYKGPWSTATPETSELKPGIKALPGCRAPLCYCIVECQPIAPANERESWSAENSELKHGFKVNDFMALNTVEELKMQAEYMQSKSKKTPEDFILCKPGCKSPECYCIGECQPWTTNSMKHPYSGPTFDYDGPWSTATERDAVVEQVNQALKEQVEKERQRAKENGWPATTSSPERTPDELRMAVLDKYGASMATEAHRLQRIGIQLRDIVDALESRYSKQARFDRALMWLLFICGWGAFIASLWLRYL